MNKRYTMLVALVVMLSAAISVEAVQSTSIQNSESASASWSLENMDMGTTFENMGTISLSVDKTSSGTSISVGICTRIGGAGVQPSIPNPCKYSSLFTTDKIFDMSSLNSATLSPVNITLFDDTTNTAQTVTIKAKWKGVGKTTNSQSFYRSSNDFNTMFFDKSESRDAIATGTINDLDLGNSEFARLAKDQSIQISSQK